MSNRLFSQQALTVSHVLLACTIISWGCGAGMISGGGSPESFAPMEENFREQLLPGKNISSFAFWHGINGEHWAVAATDGSDALAVYDIKKGSLIQQFGKTGDDTSEFRNPCDVIVAEDFVFVLERRNHRVQVLGLPDFTSLGMIGGDRLKKPSKMALYRIENGAFYLYIADSQSSAGEEVTHVLRYSVSRAVTTIHNTYLTTFGYAPGSGYLHTVEAMTVDPANRQLLITDSEQTRKTVKVFTLEGEFTGNTKVIH